MDIDTDKLIDVYKKERLMSTVSDYLMNRTNRNLDEEEKRLSIMEHKMRLGLPMSDDDYEEATNEGKSFFSRIAPSGAKSAMQAIPRPGFLDGKSSNSFFKIARPAEVGIESMLFGLPMDSLGAAKNGKLKSILDLFRK